jgi:thiol-disulfide isomerase/thioredoxin
MKVKIITIFVLVFLVGLVFFLVKTPGKSGELDGFASCIKDSGAVFYGAFWCPHCHDQKALFGRSAKKLPYVECSQPNGNGQFPICNEKEIKSYPTWDFSDGTRKISVISLEELASLTGCVLP